jgi:hypothetical protein
MARLAVLAACLAADMASPARWAQAEERALPEALAAARPALYAATFRYMVSHHVEMREAHWLCLDIPSDPEQVAAAAKALADLASADRQVQPASACPTPRPPDAVQLEIQEIRPVRRLADRAEVWATVQGAAAAPPVKYRYYLLLQEENWVVTAHLKPWQPPPPTQDGDATP